MAYAGKCQEPLARKGLSGAGPCTRFVDGLAGTRRWVACAEAERMVAEPDLSQIIAYFCANRAQFAA